MPELQAPSQPQTFDQVNNLFNRSKAIQPELAGMTLADYSRLANEQTGTPYFNAGTLPDNIVTQASRGLDTAIESTGLPQATGEAMGKVGQSIDQGTGATGYKEALTEAGQDLPGGAARMAPMMVAGLPGLGVSALLSGAKTYSDTGSPVAGAISAGGMALAPAVMGAGGTATSKFLTPQLEKFLGGRVGDLTSQVAEKLGGQGALYLSQAFGTGQAESLAEGQGLYNPLEGHKIAQAAVGQLPFLALDIPDLVRGEPSQYTRTNIVNDATRAAEARQRTIDGTPPALPEPLALMRPGSLVHDGDRGFVTWSAETPEDVVPKDVKSNPEALALPAPVGKMPEPFVMQADPTIVATAKAIEDRPAGIDPVGQLTELKNLITTTGLEESVRPYVNDQKLVESIQQGKETTYPPEAGVARAIQAAKVKIVDTLQGAHEVATAVHDVVNGKLPVVPDRVHEGINLSKNPLVADKVAYEAWSRAHTEEPEAVEDLKRQRNQKVIVDAVHDLADAKVLNRLNIPAKSNEEKVARVAAMMKYAMTDKTDRKALSGAQREFSKAANVDPKSVKKFVDEHLPKLAQLPSFKAFLGQPKGKVEFSKWLEGANGRPNVEVASIRTDPTRFFTKLARSLGYTKEEIPGFVDLATRITQRHAQPNEFGFLSGDSFLRGAATQSPEGKQGVYLNPQSPVGEDFSPENRFANLTTLGHETWHTLGQQIEAGLASSKDQQTYARMGQLAESLSPQERLSILNDLHEALGSSLKGEGSLINRSGAEYAAQTPKEFLAEAAGLLAYKAEGKDNDISGYLKFAPKPIQDFAQMVYSKLADVARMVKSFFGVQGDPLSKTYAELVKHYEALTQPHRDVVEAQNRFTAMQGVMPDSIMAAHDMANSGDNPLNFKAFDDVQYSKWADQARSVLGLTPDDKTNLPKDTSTFAKIERGLYPPSWIVKSNLYLQHVYELGQQWGSQAQSTYRRMAATLSGAKGALYNDVAVDGKARKAFNTIAQEQQRAGDGKPTLDPLGEEKVRARLKDLGVTGKSADNVAEYFNRLVESNKAVIPERDQSMQSTQTHFLADMLRAKNPTMDGQQLEMIATQIHQAKIAGQDPLLTTAGLMVNDPNYVNTLSKSWDILDGVRKETIAKMNARLGYIPESRPGPFGLSYERNGVTKYDGFKSKKELNDFIVSGTKDPSFKVNKSYDYRGRPSDFSDSNPEILKSYAAHEKALYEQALSILPADKREEVLKKYTPNQSMLEDLASQSVKRNWLHREGVPNEWLDYLTSHLTYLNSTARNIARQNVRELLPLRMTDPEVQKNPEMASWMKKQVELSLSAKESDLTKKLKLGMFNYDLGMNLPVMMTELFQPMQVLGPNLTREGAKFGGFPTMLKAAMDMGDSKVSGKYKDPKVDAAVKWAKDNGHVDSGELEQVADSHTLDAVRMKAAQDEGTKFTQMKDLLQSSLYHTLKIPKEMFSVFTHANSELAFVAGYKHFIEQGLSEPDARAKAGQMALDSNPGSGGAFNRGGFFKSEDQTAHSALSMAYMFRGYTHAMFGMYSHMVKEALGKTGLQGAELSNARVAAGQAIVTQLVLAGALGMPVLSQTLGLVKQILPHSKPEEDMRTVLASMAGQNTALGSLFSEAVMSGVPRVLPGLSAVNVQGKFALDDFMGVDRRDGFSFAGLMGTGASLGEDIWNVAKDVDTGRYRQLAKDVAPPAFKNAVDMYQNDGKVYNSKGELMYEPSGPENLLRLAGFTPGKVAQVRDQMEMQSRSEDVAKDKMQVMTMDLARTLTTAPQGLLQVKQALIQQKAQDPNFDVLSAAQEVAKKVVERSVPVDPLREGAQNLNFESRQNIAQSFAFSKQLPSAVERLQTQKQVERQFGWPGLGQINLGEMRQATLVDDLMRRDPSISMSQAEYMVSRMQFAGAKRASVGQGQGASASNVR